jgi:hypothetical protein
MEPLLDAKDYNVATSLALSSNGFDWVGALERPRPEPKAG